MLWTKSELEKQLKLEEDRLEAFERMLEDKRFNDIYRDEKDVQGAIDFQKNEIRLIEAELNNRSN